MRLLPPPFLAVALLAVLGTIAPATAKTAPTLTGQTWQLNKLAGIPRSSLGITAAFTSTGKVSGFSGCNSYSGTYTSSGTSISVSDNVAVTSKACRKGLMATERAYLAALTAARTYSVEHGTLTLMGKRSRTLATFTVQSESLVDTHWNVIAYNNGKQAVVSVNASTKLTATFTKVNITGFAGCNDYNASYTATPPKISFGPVASTRKACGTPAGVMEQESAFLAALAAAATYSMQGTTLEFHTADNAIAVTMQRAG
jgi:heat shock protein HslJ